jgi:hypothetical protein
METPAFPIPDNATVLRVGISLPPSQLLSAPFPQHKTHFLWHPTFTKSEENKMGTVLADPNQRVLDYPRDDLARPP